MPTYQYRCLDCSNELEAVQKFTDDPLTDCPDCDGTLRKVYSAVGVVFKGSGFYATDNRSKGSATSTTGSDAKSEGGAASAPAGGNGEKSTAGATGTTKPAAAKATSKPAAGSPAA